MPIYEVKNPQPRPVETGDFPRRIEPVSAILPVVKIRHLPEERRGQRRGTADRQPVREDTLPASLRALGQQVDQLNADFSGRGVDIHLQLLLGENAITLEIYDCSSGRFCAMVQEREIAVTRLGAFLSRLQQEVGVLIDTVS